MISTGFQAFLTRFGGKTVFWDNFGPKNGRFFASKRQINETII